MKKPMFIFILVIIYTFSFSLPALAFQPYSGDTTSSLNHSAIYSCDGSIYFKKQAGHFCNTGAEMKQIIRGDGNISKTMNIFMIGGYLEVDDANNWVTAPDAMRNLEVTTAIEL
ncbi:MAG: hypothetical protein MUO76_05710, partial [Anaerolineaceae bacterium]|nr:hypothetical protein [Anaerolineaceae bacterium]